MFYSHPLLAKKGPLGTVWMAAFLQNKLRKSQVVLINIASSVDRIMYPEVPIALRLSGHLLVGVVRIYSMKVDYLHHDCNVALTHLRDAYSSIQVNLPEDAVRAPFDSITRPETLELDALNVPEVNYHESPDIHLKSLDEITIQGMRFYSSLLQSFFPNCCIKLTCHISADRDISDGNPYITILIDEDKVEIPLTGYQPKYRPQEDVLPPFVGDFDVGTLDPGPSKNGEGGDTIPLDQPVNDVPEIEKMRDAVMTYSHEAYDGQPEPVDEIATEKKHSSSSQENFLAEPVPFLLDGTPLGRGHIGGTNMLDLSASVSHIRSHEIADPMLEPTPPSKENIGVKLQKRRQFFDRTLVLANQVIKKQLESARHLQRKRKSLPCSKLDVWKYTKRLKRDNLFFEPSIFEASYDLNEIFHRSFVPVMEACSTRERSPVEPWTNELTSQADAVAEEIEYNRGQVDEAIPQVFSPSREELNTPQAERVMEMEIVQTPDLRLPMDQSGTEVIRTEDQFSVDGTNMPAFTMNSFQTDDLSFVEADSRQSGRDEREVENLSVRTRAVAQYLIKKSPLSQDHKSPSGNLSLNMILQGKTRKQCARMFFETLVLTNCGFLEVKQNDAYGDILLSVTATLLNANV